LKLSKKFEYKPKHSIVCFLGSDGAHFIEVSTDVPWLKIGVILPSLYYAKIETLPVKSVLKAKELASAVFDGYLPKDKKYSYCAKKISDNRFCLIAYCLEDIMAILKKSGEQAQKTMRWYFSQTAIDKNESIKISNDNTLVFIDEIAQELQNIVLAPKLQDIKIKNDFLCGFWSFQKRQIDVWQQALTVSLCAISLAFLVQIIYYIGNWRNNIELQNTIATNIGAKDLDALKSEIDSFDEVATVQNSLRGTILLLKDAPSSAILESFKITDKKMEAVFNSTKPSEVKAYFAPLKPDALIISGDTISVIMSIK
jgi:hypothetical protein